MSDDESDDDWFESAFEDEESAGQSETDSEHPFDDGGSDDDPFGGDEGDSPFAVEPSEE